MQKFLTVGALLALFACGDDGIPSGDAIRVTTQLSRSTFNVGDTIQVVISVKNIGASAITLELGGCDGWFEVFQGNTQVYPGNMVCGAPGQETSVAPGESFTRTSLWHGEIYGLHGEPSLLPPAEYALRANVELLTNSGAARTNSETTPLTIRAR